MLSNSLFINHPTISFYTAGIATGCTAGVRFSLGARYFSLLSIIRTDSGTHPASYRMGTGNSFPGGKAVGRERDHSPPPSAEAKNGGVIPPLPHTSSWRGA
jgi:hypothetical protein